MQTSWKAKLTGALATAAITAGLLPMAAFGAGALTLDGSISVTGLDEGDTASYYQIIQQDTDTSEDTYTVATAYAAGTQYYTKDGATYTAATIADADAFAAADEGSLYTKDLNGTNDWELTALVDSDHDGKVDGSDYTVANFVILDEDATNKKVITADMANAIAAAIVNNSAAATGSMTVTTAEGATTASAEDVDAGLYMVSVIPASKDIIYKPIFVSADYYNTTSEPDDGTDTIALVTDETDYNTDPKVFKKSQVTIDKKSGEYDGETAVDTMHDVAVGDVVPFTITVPLVTYTKDYTNPQFKISDVLTTGLELCKLDGSAATTDDITVTVKDGTSDVTATPWTSDEAAADYKVTINSVTNFEVAFRNDANFGVDADKDGTADNDQDGFLYNTHGTAPTVTITYYAKVTSEAAAQVNQMDNTATLNFSNEPTDEDGAGELEDKTRHYTFGIDANIFGGGHYSGGDSDQTSEIRKIFLAADGTVVEEVTTTDIKGESTEGDTEFTWLEGAEFELKQTHFYQDNDPASTPKDNPFAQLATPLTITFKDGLKSDAADAKGPVSDASGYITMKGLDAGIYQLKETEAPAGYTFDPSKVYTITITPTYVMDGLDPENEILSSYSVKIEFVGDDDQDHSNVTTYTAGEDANGNVISFLNDAGTINDDASLTRNDEADPVAETTLIVNKKLGLLPATGGSGIFFYLGIGGAIAAVALFFLSKNKRELDELTAA